MAAYVIADVEALDPEAYRDYQRHVPPTLDLYGGRFVVRGGAIEVVEHVARAVANSPLVKAALHGGDPNWGRIAQAAGMALAGEELPELGPAEIDAAELGGGEREAELAIALRRGDGEAHVYFSDLTKRYVEINAEYTT